MMDGIEKYADIINLAHHQSAVRPRMSMSDRAAQFAPFATVTGYEDAILETQRLTDEWTAPTEEEARELNQTTGILSERIAAGERPAVSVTYFVPDEKKAGGSYRSASGHLRRIDEAAGVFIMEDGTRILTRYICAVIFPAEESSGSIHDNDR